MTSMRYRSPQKIKNMIKPDYSLYLDKPEMLNWIESEWLAHPEIHDAYAKAVNDTVKKFKLKSVIEIGCATGKVAERLNVKEYYGYDANQKCIKIARNNVPGKKFFVGDIRGMTALYSKEDLVCAFSILKHFGLHEWADIFKKIASLGDYFIFNMPVIKEGILHWEDGKFKDAAPFKDDGTEFHHVWISPIEMEKQINDAGFEILETRSDNPIEPLFICKRK